MFPPKEQNESDKLESSIHCEKSIKYEAFNLTDIQQAYLMGRQSYFSFGSKLSYIYIENIKDKINISMLQTALNYLINRHDMLRAIIDKNGMQRILTTVPEMGVKVNDLSTYPPDEIKNKIEQERSNIINSFHPIDKWPLFNIQISLLPENKCCIYFYFDLLIMDGKGVSNFFNELSCLYQNINYSLPEIKTSYRDYVLYLNKMEKSPKFLHDKEYWLKKIPSLSPAPELSLKSQSENSNSNFVRKNFKISSERWKEIKENANKINVTAGILICTIYCKIISHWSRSQNFILNLMFFDRPSLFSGINDIVANFSSTTLLNVDFRKEKNLQESAKDIQQEFTQNLNHSLFNGIKVLQEMNKFSEGSNNITAPVVFVCDFNFFNSKETNSEQSHFFKWFGSDVSYTKLETPYVTLDHQIYEDIDGSLYLNWDVLEDVFPSGMIDEMFLSYKNILLFYSDWDNKKDNYFNAYICNKEYIEKIKNINQIKNKDFFGYLHEGFLKKTKEFPNKIAIVNGGKEFSYKDIYNISFQIYKKINDEKINLNSPIAVVMEKGWEQIAAVLGILMSGSYYIPIDGTLPRERILQLVNSAQAVAIVTQKKLKNEIHFPDKLPIFIPEEEDKYINNKEVFFSYKQKPTDLAYIIFTSGSTGVPKGVMIEHRSALNTINDINERFSINDQDTVICFASLSFDLSVYDIFSLLSCGGKLIIPLPAEMQNPECWKMLIQENNVSVWNTAPPLMQMFIEYLLAKNEKSFQNKIKLILLSGDWIPVSLPDKMNIYFKNAEMISLGGATEASIWSNFYKINGNKLNCPSIPYGKPLKNQAMFILGNNYEIRPTWVVGMIFIGGIGLARGYWNDIEKTNNAFIIHPVTGERLYKTGDFGRYLPSGDIEFLGRQDNQVKIHGYRVELCEIEAVILKHPLIATVVVRAVGETSATRHLICYFTFKVLNESLCHEKKSSFINSEIKDFVSKKLPYYMTPNRYIELEKIPVTANGKVDNQALLKLAIIDCNSNLEVKMPKTKIEKDLAFIWQKLLKIDKVGTNENFFQLGGQSFLAFQMMNEIYQKFSVHLSLTSLFQGGTIFHLAQKIECAFKEQNEFEQVLVNLQEGGSGESFFCFHPSGGNIFCYNELSKHFAEKRPFVGVQSLGLVCDLAENMSLEEMAKFYCKAIQSYQKSGPYSLGGWSFGGVLAFEVAKLLLEQKENVLPVILIDSPAPYARKLPNHDYLEKWFFKDFGARLNELNIEQKEKLFNVFKMNVFALSNYKSIVTNIPVHIIKARLISMEELLNHPFVQEKDWGWSKITNNVMSCIELEADHYSILEGNNVSFLANHLINLGVIPFSTVLAERNSARVTCYDK